MSNPPSLTIVPTPIGNLGDITLRAIETLKSVDLVYAEDTRKTLSLFNHLGIKKKIKSYHKDNEKSSSNNIINDIQNGNTIALVSDAGTPCISDPGNVLVQELINEKIDFISLPGATAFVPALISSGFPADQFYFYGFLPQRGNKKTEAIKSVQSINSTILFYESPHRIQDTLKQLLEHYPNGRIAFSREITKIYEETVWIKSEADIATVTEKGEFVVILDNNSDGSESAYTQNNDLTDIANKLIKEKITGKDAVKVLKVLGMKRNAAYQLIEELSK